MAQSATEQVVQHLIAKLDTGNGKFTVQDLIRDLSLSRGTISAIVHRMRTTGVLISERATGNTRSYQWEIGSHPDSVRVMNTMRMYWSMQRDKAKKSTNGAKAYKKAKEPSKPQITTANVFEKPGALLRQIVEAGKRLSQLEAERETLIAKAQAYDELVEALKSIIKK